MKNASEADSVRDRRVVEEIEKRYGSVIDLKKSPGVLIEILRNFGGVVRDDPPGTSTVAVGITPGTGGGGGTGSGGTGSGGTGTGGTGTGGVSAGTSTVAVGITPPEHDPGDDVANSVVLRAVLALRGDVRAISRILTPPRAPATAKARIAKTKAKARR
ncbi:MAG TPA: hypothetical protein VGP07_16290 [Polyangia bacterium]|jgi:hypothetical protein